MSSSSILALRRVAIASRSLRTSARFYSEGATGSQRPQGSGDSFTKREKAQEDFYVREHEKEQLAALKESLKQQKDQLADLEKKINNFSK